MSNAGEIIHNNMVAVYHIHQCLKDFIVAHDDCNEEQMLSVYHTAVKAIEFYEKTQAGIVDTLIARSAE